MANEINGPTSSDTNACHGSCLTLQAVCEDEDSSQKPQATSRLDDRRRRHATIALEHRSTSASFTTDMLPEGHHAPNGAEPIRSQGEVRRQLRREDVRLASSQARAASTRSSTESERHPSPGCVAGKESEVVLEYRNRASKFVPAKLEGVSEPGQTYAGAECMGLGEASIRMNQKRI